MHLSVTFKFEMHKGYSLVLQGNTRIKALFVWDYPLDIIQKKGKGIIEYIKVKHTKKKKQVVIYGLQ